jgi:hypothetical protein
MSDGEKATPAIDPELLACMNGPHPRDENGVDPAAIDYLLAMTPTQRVQRHAKARPVVDALNAFARQHGLKSMGWTISGPPDADAPDLSPPQT